VAERTGPEPVIHEGIHRTPTELVQVLQGAGTATVVESMGPVVGPAQTMGPAMVRRTTRARVAGPAITAASGYADNLMMHAALRVARAGDVMVVTAHGSPGAQWGELVAHAAMSKGIAAVVIEGAVRDVDDIDQLGFPVWSTAVAAPGARKEVLGWVNRPVSCAGVRVEPGDIIVADGDGVVVVPRRMVPEVVAAAEQRLERERGIRSAARAGRLPGELTGSYERLDASGIRVVPEPWEPE
jgi:4-hydroxy-4-methyl-2-oxoglutarate aldolase